MEMIDVDNPLSGYNNNNNNKLRTQRIQSFTDKNINAVEESSGLTLGLILKEYCEFQGLTSMLFRILHNILIVCVVLGIQNNFFIKGSMTSANFHYETLNSLIVPNSPYDLNSCQDSMTAAMKNMENVISSSISQNPLDSNLLSVGNTAYMITGAINLCIPDNPEDYGLPSIDCTSDTCNRARALLNNTISTPLLSTFQYICVHCGGGFCNGGKWQGAILFDTRNTTWTAADSSNAVSFAINEVIPILSFSQLFNVDVIFQDKVHDSILAKIVVGCGINAGGGYQFYTVNAGSPYRGTVYDNAPWRLLMILLLFFVNLLEIWFELEDYKINTVQSSSSYWYNAWNWLDWLFESTILIFTLLQLILNSKISSSGFGYEPVYNISDWYYRSQASAIGLVVIVFQYVYCGSFFLNLLRFFKVFRYHISLRIYLRFLKELFEMIGGFISFFVILALQFALLFYVITSVSGFNKSFGTFSSSVNEILQVTFGFVDYDSFTSNSFGLGGFTLFVIIFFYVAVIIFTVIMQNIILAIIGNAHDVARRPENSASNIMGLLVTMILFHVTTVVPIALLSLYDLLLQRNSQRVNSATRVLDIIDPFVAKFFSWIHPSWKKYSAFVKHDSLLKCLSFVYIDCQSDELKVKHSGKILKFAKYTRVSVNLELIGRAPYIDETTKKEFIDISRGSKGVATIESVNDNSNEILLTFESSDAYYSRLKQPLEEQQNNQAKSQRFWIFNESKIPSIVDIREHLKHNIFPAPSSAFNIFNEILSTEVELVRLIKVATDILDTPGCLPYHPISQRALFQKLDEGDVNQAGYDFFELYVSSEMNSYKVFESDIIKSRQCTSVFEVVDDGIDSKRRFEQTYTGGFRNSMLFQKLDESIIRLENQNIRLEKRFNDEIKSLRDEIRSMRSM